MPIPFSQEDISQAKKTIPFSSSSVQTNQQPEKNFWNSGVGGFATGVGQGLASLPVRTGQLIANAGTYIAKKVTGNENLKTNIPEIPEYLKPKTTSQKVGYGTEQVGEFLWPTGLEAKGASMLSKFAPKLETGISKIDKVVKGGLNLAGKSIGSGTEFAGKQALQTQDPNEVKNAGIIGLATPGVVKGVTAIANKIAPVAASVLAEMIGKEPEHIIRAFQNPVAVAKKIAEKVVPFQVREKAINALTGFRKSFSEDFSKGLESLQNSSKAILPETMNTKLKSLTGQPMTNVVNSVKTFVQDQVEGIPNIFRKANISVPGSGKLNFLKSAVVSGGEKTNLQAVFDTINSQKDFSPKGMQAVAARINALTSFAEGSKNMSSKIVAEIHSLYSDAIKKVYPELAKLRSSYSASTQIWQGIDEILKSVKNEVANPTAATTAAKKLSNVFAEDNDAYMEALKRLEKVSGVDLLNDLAATEFKNLVPRRFGSVMMQAGALAGGLFYNPLIFAMLPLFSPKLMGKAVTTAGKIAPYVEPVLKSIPKALTPLLK